MGEAKWFLGIKINQDMKGGTISLTQTDYIDALLKNSALFPGLQNCNSVDTPCSNASNIDKSLPYGDPEERGANSAKRIPQRRRCHPLLEQIDAP